MTIDEDARPVLLVDQTGALERRLDGALVEAGFAVTTVASAGDCLSRIERGDIDGVVSAYALPDLDGLQLLRSIRVSYPELPFVLVPEEGSEALAGDAVAAGASGYVPRDDEPATLVSRLQDSLRQGRSGRDADGEGHQRYRHLIGMSPAPINVFDESGESIWCNQAVLDLLGFDSREEFIGRSILDVIHPDDHELARREIGTVTERKESTGPTRMRLLSRDGGTRYVRVSTAIGEFLGADIGQAVAIDVTDREERDRQLQVLDQWLRHNIRNETTVIRGLAENIERGSADDVGETARRIQEHADRLVEQANHERTIIDVLTRASDRDRIPVDVTRIVERQAARSRETYPDADIRVTRTDGFEVNAIPELETAIGELIENAVQHNDAGTPTAEVEVARTADGGGVVRVADNGPGIPEIERGGPLLDREVDQLHHGSGLGLVLVYWAVRLSGGEIAFGENDPRGSVVTLAFSKPRPDEGNP